MWTIPRCKDTVFLGWRTLYFDRHIGLPESIKFQILRSFLERNLACFVRMKFSSDWLRCRKCFSLAVNDGVDVYLDTFAKVQHRFPSLRKRKQRYRLVLGRAGQILSIERLGDVGKPLCGYHSRIESCSKHLKTGDPYKHGSRCFHRRIHLLEAWVLIQERSIREMSGRSTREVSTIKNKNKWSII